MSVPMPIMTPAAARRAAVRRVEVEARGMGVDLDRRAGPRGGADNLLHVDLERVAHPDEAPRRMGENARVRILHRANDALRHGVAGHLEFRMNRDVDDVEAREQSSRPCRASRRGGYRPRSP